MARTLLDRSSYGISRTQERQVVIMLYWAAVFFVIALVAAFFGFGGIASESAWAAKILFVVFLALTVVSFLFGRRGSAT